jgi:hypothetical protein
LKCFKEVGKTPGERTPEEGKKGSKSKQKTTPESAECTRGSLRGESTKPRT